MIVVCVEVDRRRVLLGVAKLGVVRVTILEVK